MTPQLRQAIKLLQMSTTELELEIAEAVETNPLLEWADEAAHAANALPVEASSAASTDDTPREEPAPAERDDDWSQDELQWTGSGSGGSFDDDESGDAAERVAEAETLADHLLWQLHLSPLSPRDRQIGAMLIDALDEDGYLREPLSAILETLALGAAVDEADVLTVLHQIQRFDPVGVVRAPWANAWHCSWPCSTRPPRGANWRCRSSPARWSACRAAAWPVWRTNSSAPPPMSTRRSSWCARWIRVRASRSATCRRTPMWCRTA